jgi:anthranilate phosphoribosyltransferase
VAPVRRALKIKTFFNMLGPMVNPSFPGKQLIGVYSLELARLYNYLYQLGHTRYIIVHSLDGYDEISLTADFKYILNGVEKIASPGSFGFEKTLPADLSGGNTIPEAAAIFMRILEGNGTVTQNNVVLANSELALRCYFPDRQADDCRKMAAESLAGGKALAKFKKLIQLQS